jgi:adenine C2-methylase RlmN of 23S rRNA A2503 and tRNA A37
MEDSVIKISGYDLLGSQGKDGIRFAWHYLYNDMFVESAAFHQRSTRISDNICGYTTSVSAGCMLKSFNSHCLFCRTGSLLPFCGPLSYYDIAKQNIFMVLADMYCDDHTFLHNRPREFAYMGQGEPGLSYSQLRLAIEITNRAMKELGQSVYRHVFATSGVPEAIIAFKNDIKNFYTERVTLHFSLHATYNRELIMPIERLYSYKTVLQALDDIHAISGEKPCIGIMLFDHFYSHRNKVQYSNGFKEIKQILSELDPQKHRLSFCEYNPSDDICRASKYSSINAEKILLYAKELGFEAKLFSSFGKEEQTACGMLAGKKPEQSASQKWRTLEKQAEELVHYCSRFDQNT